MRSCSRGPRHNQYSSQKQMPTVNRSQKRFEHDLNMICSRTEEVNKASPTGRAECGAARNRGCRKQERGQGEFLVSPFQTPPGLGTLLLGKLTPALPPPLPPPSPSASFAFLFFPSPPTYNILQRRPSTHRRRLPCLPQTTRASTGQTRARHQVAI